MAPAADRLAMVKSAVRGRRGFEASAVEVRSPRTSYSIYTLTKIRKVFPGARLFFILGADAFLEIKTWREWRRVLDRCVFIVMTRKALESEYRGRMAAVRKTTDVDALIRAGRTILFSRIDALPVSSTEIRRRVREGRPIGGLVPNGVAARIRSGKLYQG
jgi:nicotinate-nucleotide adenylyltransferase